MDNLFQSTDIWIGAVAEIVHKYSAATINFLVETFGLTSDLGSIVRPSDGLFLDAVECVKQFSGLLAFDYFQWQLLKIFMSLLISIVFGIFCAWYVYGARISERFMDSAQPIEGRNNFKYYSPNL